MPSSFLQKPVMEEKWFSTVVTKSVGAMPVELNWIEVEVIEINAFEASEEFIAMTAYSF